MSPVYLIRHKLLITQTNLANKLGISRQMVWAYEKGRSMPSFEVAKKLIEIANDHGITVNAIDFFINNRAIKISTISVDKIMEDTK